MNWDSGLLNGIRRQIERPGEGCGRLESLIVYATVSWNLGADFRSDRKSGFIRMTGACRLAAIMPFVVLLLLGGCEDRREAALGTLEWDRIALPSPAAEKIVTVQVREGQRVTSGQVLLELDPARTRAQLQAAEAAVARQQAQLDELNAGPRIEEIERAKANLAAARAEAVDRQADYKRLQDLGTRNFVSKSDIDGARAAAESAQAQVRAAREQLLELQRGYRVEDIEQGRASLGQALSDAAAQRVLLEKLVVRAPRSGLVDSIPFKLGDQAPVGASLVVMLVGDTPYARVYVPQPMRSGVRTNQLADIYLDGSDRAYRGHVRMIRNTPSFTPYYALTGDDVARLSYVAEIQLQQSAADLPAGLPLRAEFLAETVSAQQQEGAAALPDNGVQEKAQTPAAAEEGYGDSETPLVDDDYK